MEHRKIAFIGAGNMTASIISGLIGSGYPSELVMASNPSNGKLNDLNERFSIQTTQDNNIAVDWADVVVLSVKPQIMASVCAEFIPSDSLNNTLFISIAAGIQVKRLKQMLNADVTVIRCMPNTPSMLGKGMSGLFADASSTELDKKFAGDLMHQVGEIAWVETEQMIDVVIATAGSSPAYFFLFLEAMQNHALTLGLDKDTSRLLVQQAMLGAAEMVCHNPDLELSQLRAQVTSKGGTTAKAIEHFQEQGLERIIAESMQAAIVRASEMSKQF
jgi:pyrroline-5-carboxylate reductase